MEGVATARFADHYDDITLQATQFLHRTFLKGMLTRRSKLTHDGSLHRFYALPITLILALNTESDELQAPSLSAMRLSAA